MFQALQSRAKQLRDGVWHVVVIEGLVRKRNVNDLFCYNDASKFAFR